MRQQERSGFQLAGDRQGCSAANHSGLRRRHGTRADRASIGHPASRNAKGASPAICISPIGEQPLEPKDQRSNQQDEKEKWWVNAKSPLIRIMIFRLRRLTISSLTSATWRIRLHSLTLWQPLWLAALHCSVLVQVT